MKELPTQHVVAVKRYTSLARIGEDIQAGFGQIWGAIGPRGIVPAGAPFLVMYDVIDEETEGDVEVCVPVAEPFEGHDGVYGREVEAVTAATTMHHGPYDELGPAYHTLTGWVQEHGHEIAGPPREVYLTASGDAGSSRLPHRDRLPDPLSASAGWRRATRGLRSPPWRRAAGSGSAS